MVAGGRRDGRTPLSWKPCWLVELAVRSEHLLFEIRGTLGVVETYSVVFRLLLGCCHNVDRHPFGGRDTLNGVFRLLLGCCHHVDEHLCSGRDTLNGVFQRLPGLLSSRR